MRIKLHIIISIKTSFQMNQPSSINFLLTKFKIRIDLFIVFKQTVPNAESAKVILWLVFAIEVKIESTKLGQNWLCGQSNILTLFFYLMHHCISMRLFKRQLSVKPATKCFCLILNNRYRSISVVSLKVDVFHFEPYHWAYGFFNFIKVILFYS
jgi:hypothetical protein